MLLCSLIGSSGTKPSGIDIALGLSIGSRVDIGEGRGFPYHKGVLGMNTTLVKGETFKIQDSRFIYLVSQSGR